MQVAGHEKWSLQNARRKIYWETSHAWSNHKRSNFPAKAMDYGIAGFEALDQGIGFHLKMNEGTHHATVFKQDSSMKG